MYLPSKENKTNVISLHKGWNQKQSKNHPYSKWQQHSWILAHLLALHAAMPCSAWWLQALSHRGWDYQHRALMNSARQQLWTLYYMCAFVQETGSKIKQGMELGISYHITSYQGVKGISSTGWWPRSIYCHVFVSQFPCDTEDYRHTLWI